MTTWSACCPNTPTLPFTHGTSLCFNNSFWTAGYPPVTGAGGATVFVN